MAGGTISPFMNANAMNKEQTASQLRLAADIIETGHPFEVEVGRENWQQTKLPVDACVREKWPIRLALAAPLDNRPLHNPDNLTAEQVGVGWRLLVVGETMPEGYAYWLATESEWYYNGSWAGYAVSLRNANTSCRAPLSTPWPFFIDPATRVVSEGVDSLTLGKPANPTFQLPPPPPGMQWHRTDGWTAEMLPQGYRPVTLGEQTTHQSCESLIGHEWVVQSGGCAISNAHRNSFIRTTRPLTFTHSGKTWTWHRPGDRCPCGEQERVTVLYSNPVQEHIGTPCPAHRFAWKNLSGLTPIIGWRYTDEPKMVELGPEDVPPGSVVRGPADGTEVWAAVTTVTSRSIGLTDGRCISYKQLQEDKWLINRSIPLTGRWNPNSWEPCHKLAF